MNCSEYVIVSLYIRLHSYVSQEKLWC
jgi:hypothetical protein